MISKNQIKFIKQLALKKHRQQQGLFVAEGPKVVADLLAAGFGVHTLYATTDWETPDDMRSLHGMKPTLVTPDELRVDLKPVGIVPKGVAVSFKVPCKIRPSDKLFVIEQTGE